MKREVEVILTVDPSVMPREEFKDSLRQLLGVSELNIAELDTPPYTPDSPKSGIKQQIPTDHDRIPGAAMPDSESQEMTDWAEKVTCKHCNESIGGDKRLIEETPSRLGISELVKIKNLMKIFYFYISEGKDPFLLITMLL